MKTIHFATSQHVSVEFELAHPMLRLGASLLDLLALVIYEVIIGMIFGVTFNSKIGNESIFTVLSFFIFTFPFLLYSPIFEYFTNGKSLGKMICGIRVVHVNGENAGFKEYFTRWLFRVPDLWMSGGFIALFFSSTSETSQRLGDMMANTLVINSRTSSTVSLTRLVNNLNQNSEVTYNNLTQFTDTEMLAIKKSIERVRLRPTEQNKAMVIATAERMSTLLGFDKLPEKPIPFLTKIVKDYVIQTR
jgi:uncharacterized RDD family membrane protein YckC